MTGMVVTERHERLLGQTFASNILLTREFVTSLTFVRLHFCMSAVPPTSSFVLGLDLLVVVLRILVVVLRILVVVLRVLVVVLVW